MEKKKTPLNPKPILMFSATSPIRDLARIHDNQQSNKAIKNPIIPFKNVVYQPICFNALKR